MKPAFCKMPRCTLWKKLITVVIVFGGGCYYFLYSEYLGPQKLRLLDSSDKLSEMTSSEVVSRGATGLDGGDSENVVVDSEPIKEPIDILRKGEEKLGRTLPTFLNRIENGHVVAASDPNQTLPLANFDLIEKFVDIIVFFAKATENKDLAKKFKTCVTTLLTHSSVPVRLHIIGDNGSQKIAQKIIKNDFKPALTRQLEVVTHNVQKITATLHSVVSDMQEHFSYRPGAYYSDALFFLSLAIHRVFLQHRVIMIDIDVKFVTDVWQLHQEFGKFAATSVIGIAYEQQPVYRHMFQVYRHKNPTTSVGGPPPDGIPGFNSGVLLLDLERMRNSEVYNRLLNAAVVDKLVEKYSFKGNLGDQDFFTIVSIDNPELFYVLPCGWNRQLCQYWRVHGYATVFDAYYQCNESISLYHGNCNTPFP